MATAVNYKQSSVTGEKWQRACRVVVENPYNGSPSILFVEEEAINFGGEVVTRLCANTSLAFDLESSFPILDPATGLPTGKTATHMEVYALLNSLYMYTATKRDEGGGALNLPPPPMSE